MENRVDVSDKILKLKSHIESKQDIWTLKEFQNFYHNIDISNEINENEKELLAEHKEDLKKWSMSDGKILLKLINRETERTPYTLIKDFRGDIRAVFWQGIARIFSNNLKSGYDAEEEDRILEEIVTLIEAGYL